MISDEHFGPKPGSLSTFDAFPKTRTSYRTRTSRGGATTLLVLTACAALLWYEFLFYLDGTEEHSFSVEKTIGHHMQINLDVTVAMPCDWLHINVQDAALDRILAGEVLTKEETTFDDTSAHRLVEMPGREPHVYEILRKARKSKFGKTKVKPRRRGGHGQALVQACRIYGSMDVNRVQADFHITVKGHGYLDMSGEHIDHMKFNFSHVINELSFGDLYPSLVNPLDGVAATTETHFHKFQYYLSIVPTRYFSHTSGRSLVTNQYAVTERSHEVTTHQVPGIFFKYDIEPLMLTVVEQRTPFTTFIVRVVNIIGGVMVSGNWIYKLWDVFATYLAKGRRRTTNMAGVITGKPAGLDD